MSGSSRRAFLRRSLALGVAAPSLGSLLAACTGDDDGGADGRPVPVRPAGTARKFSGTIVVSTLQNPSQQARQAVERAYRRHQPNVKIAWQTSDTDVPTYTRWLRSQLTGSQIWPDIVSGNYMPMYHGYVNLDEYRAQVNPYTGRAWEDDYDFGLYRQLDVRGERTVIGTEGSRPLWYFNKDVFSQVGVEPPTTWDALVAACAKLAAADHVPIATSFTDVMTRWMPSIYFDQYHDSWVETVRAQPGDWNWDPKVDDNFQFDAKNPRLHASYTFSPQRFYRALSDKKLRYDTPAMVQVIANLRKVFPKYATPDIFTRTDQYKPFLVGETAMMVDTSGAMALLQQDFEGITPARQRALALDKPIKKFDWDVFEFPSMRGPLVQSDTRPPEETSGDYLCVIDKSPGRTEMVMDFLMFWMSKPGFSAYVQGQAEARQLAPQGPSLVKGVEYPKELQDLVDKVKPKGVVGPAYGNFWVAGAGGKTGQELKGLFISGLQGTVDTLDYATKLQKYVKGHFPALLRQANLTAADIANPARQPSVI